MRKIRFNNVSFNGRLKWFFFFILDINDYLHWFEFDIGDNNTFHHFSLLKKEVDSYEEDSSKKWFCVWLISEANRFPEKNTFNVIHK